MTIYEIDEKILKCIDAETGEILDEEALDALEMMKKEKLENAALWIKNLTAEETALRAEAAALIDRARSKASTIEGLKRYLLNALDGGNIETVRVKASSRTTTAVEVEDEKALYGAAPHLFTIKEVYTLDKRALKEELKDGPIEGARIVTRPYVVIK